jgi:hypothetical protein
LMMAVLERVRQEKGNPVLGEREKGMWQAVVKACNWAIEGAEGKMPEGIAKKVKFVKQKLKEGTWGYALDVPGENGKMGEVAAMPEPNRTYGFVQGMQQAMGTHGYTGGQQMAGMGYGDGQQQSPMPSPTQGAAYVQQTSGQLPPQFQLPTQGMYVQGQGQGQGYGGRSSVLPPAGEYGQQGGGYLQNMGGPW